jgi:hypothetical protein
MQRCDDPRESIASPGESHESQKAMDPKIENSPGLALAPPLGCCLLRSGREGTTQSPPNYAPSKATSRPKLNLKHSLSARRPYVDCTLCSSKMDGTNLRKAYVSNKPFFGQQVFPPGADFTSHALYLPIVRWLVTSLLLS